MLLCLTGKCIKLARNVQKQKKDEQHKSDSAWCASHLLISKGEVVVVTSIGSLISLASVCLHTLYMHRWNTLSATLEQHARMHMHSSHTHKGTRVGSQTGRRSFKRVPGPFVTIAELRARPVWFVHAQGLESSSAPGPNLLQQLGLPGSRARCVTAVGSVHLPATAWST